MDEISFYDDMPHDHPIFQYLTKEKIQWVNDNIYHPKAQTIINLYRLLHSCPADGVAQALLECELEGLKV